MEVYGARDCREDGVSHSRNAVTVGPRKLGRRVRLRLQHEHHSTHFDWTMWPTSNRPTELRTWWWLATVSGMSVHARKLCPRTGNSGERSGGALHLTRIVTSYNAASNACTVYPIVAATPTVPPATIRASHIPQRRLTRSRMSVVAAAVKATARRGEARRRNAHKRARQGATSHCDSPELRPVVRPAGPPDCPPHKARRALREGHRLGVTGPLDRAPVSASQLYADALQQLATHGQAHSRQQRTCDRLGRTSLPGELRRRGTRVGQTMDTGTSTAEQSVTAPALRPR